MQHCGITNSEHAVKVKRAIRSSLSDGKRRQRQSAAAAPFVLSRGDGHTRQNRKTHLPAAATSIVSAVVIDGDSLNDSATQIGGMTGETAAKSHQRHPPGHPTGRGRDYGGAGLR